MALVRYVPPAREISNITNGFPAIVTTVLPHTYSPGIFVTIVIPYPGVMEPINGKTYLAGIVSPTQLALFDWENLIYVDTRNMTPFSTGPVVATYPTHAPPAVYVPAQKSQVVPAGEIATTLANASNVIGPRNPNG